MCNFFFEKKMLKIKNEKLQPFYMVHCIPWKCARGSFFENIVHKWQEKRQRWFKDMGNRKVVLRGLSRGQQLQLRSLDVHVDEDLNKRLK